MTIQLDHDVLDHGVDALRAEAAELEATLAHLDRRVAATLDDWHGRAAAAYSDAWSDWQRGADQVRAALGLIADAVSAAHQDLTTTDESSAEQAGRLAARLR